MRLPIEEQIDQKIDFYFIIFHYINNLIDFLHFLMIKETIMIFFVLYFERAKYLKFHINKVKRNNV
jgi:hypothetical protein